jgi:uncharacterized protein
MKWQGRRSSENVDDRRRVSGGKVAAGGGIIGIVFLVVQYFMSGGDTSALMNGVQQQMSQSQQQGVTADEPSAADDEMAKYISVALADNEDVWNKVFQEKGLKYEEPQLVLFRGATQSACGDASSSMGPFYCPGDKKVYIDLGFFDELKNKYGAKGGDFAISYVLAHEVGHHIQKLLGTSAMVHQKEQELSEKEGNKWSVSLELQADFYAGLWAHYNQKLNGVLEDGDIEEALSAAQAVGDDMIQKKARGYVVPDAFTHGTSEQRMYWFKKGFETGNIDKGNTFAEYNN